jgi:Zn finger protein HypA/HybF involved in hydrogenase expression
MHNKHKHSQKEKATVNEYAKTNDPSHDSAKALEDGLTELYLDVETVWIIARDLFQVTDQYLIKHIDANLPVLKLPSEGLVLKCSACGRSASFGSSGIRKNCYYCGELLLKPTNDEIADISSLFIPPKMGMADNDILSTSVSASYTYASPLQPGKAQKEQNSSENTRLNVRAQQTYYKCQELDESYRLIYVLLLSIYQLISEQLGTVPSDFVGAMLSKPIDVSRADTCFFYPYSVLAVLWQYISASGGIHKSQYEETKEKLIAAHAESRLLKETEKTVCSKCGRETTPTGNLYLKCPYCGSRLRDITYSDIFPDQL